MSLKEWGKIRVNCSQKDKGMVCVQKTKADPKQDPVCFSKICVTLDPNFTLHCSRHHVSGHNQWTGYYWLLTNSVGFSSNKPRRSFQHNWWFLHSFCGWILPVSTHCKNKQRNYFFCPHNLCCFIRACWGEALAQMYMRKTELCCWLKPFGLTIVWLWGYGGHLGSKCQILSTICISTFVLLHLVFGLSPTASGSKQNAISGSLQWKSPTATEAHSSSWWTMWEWL